MITDAAIRDQVAMTLRTLADYAAPTNVRGSMSGDVPDVRGIGRADHGRQPIKKDST